MLTSLLLPRIFGRVAGQWVPAESGATLRVTNPATGDRLADVPDMGAAETRRAVEAAAASLARTPTLDARREWLRKISAALLADKGEFGRIITLEQGKPLREGIAEPEYAAGFFSFFAEHLHHLEPRPLAKPIRGLNWTIHHRPAGVAALITPWNFPLAMLAKKLSAALAAGCGVVIKPSELTPLSAIALVAAVERAGVPAGQCNLVTGGPRPIGEVLCTHPAVRVVSFTGSTRVGKLLLEKTAPHVKRLALELGGNAPFIVFDDADAEKAADALMANKFRAGGQTCVCANRILVQRGLEKRFAGLVARRVSKLRVGNGLDPATDLGPLINRAAFDKAERHVVDALSRGARRVTGDPPRPPEHAWGHFFPPTVLAGVTPDMAATREETFGPVISIVTFGDEDEAVALANDTPYGLAGYVFTADESRAQRVAARLQCGHVGINTGAGPTPEAPFGGMKQSGLGREGGAEGLFEYCETQTIVKP
jgi:succinate-semialdehyde dehydrogenase/glutarate-semialdehyde dehydrogenase